MRDLIPEGIAWLSSDDRYLDGVEIGSLLMLVMSQHPVVIKARIRGMNEDQIRAAGPAIGYHVNVDSRESGWAFVTLTQRGEPEMEKA